MRGKLGANAHESWGWMREGLRLVADHAQEADLVITIEPQNSAVLDNICTTADGIAFVNDFDHPQVRLMIDAYHAEIGDTWPSLAYVSARDVLRHVHFADSDRLPPGQGRLNLVLHLATLKALGYGGFITFEIDQLDDSMATARVAVEYFKQLVD
jgi:protein FrlC